MAQYPNAVISFATKNAGDTIQPSHINTMQDEITAIEDGLLNGTAPVNSSRITAPSAQITNSTISSLTVGTLTLTGGLSAANSTFTALSVSGGSTLGTVSAGASTLADLVVTTQAPTAILTNSANINTASGSTTRLTFNTQTFTSTSGMHSTTSNPGRLTLVSSGVWMLVGQVQWNNVSTSGVRLARLLIDGSSVVAANRQRATADADVIEQSVSALYRAVSSGRYVELEVFQNSGSTCSILAQDASPSLSATRLR